MASRSPKRRPERANRDSRIFRIMDANLNRFCEGSRVIEETLRFILDRPRAARLLKEMRHRARSILSAPGRIRESLLTHRDTESDPGAAWAYDRTVLKRRTIPDLLLANFKRMQEAVRVLEEYSRLGLRKTTAAFKSLRFGVYGLEKQVMLAYFKKPKRH